MSTSVAVVEEWKLVCSSFFPEQLLQSLAAEGLKAFLSGVALLQESVWRGPSHLIATAVCLVGKPSILGALTSLTCPNVFLKYALLGRAFNARFFSRLWGNAGAFHFYVPWENNHSKFEWPKHNKQKNQGVFLFLFFPSPGRWSKTHSAAAKEIVWRESASTQLYKN